jgi:hypothetical protein
MFNCAQCTELCWDSLYGLLDAEQAQLLRAHLADCAACRAALAEAEKQQRLVAAAARLYDMPAFVAPEADAAEAEPPCAPAAPAAPSPGPRPAVVRFRPRKRLLAWVAAAAAVLLVVGGYGWYQQGLAQRQDALQEALRFVNEVEAQQASATRETTGQAQALREEVKAQPFHLRVLGPASYQPDAPHQYRVTTQKRDGAPAAARVTARVVALSKERPGRRQTLFEKKSASKGEMVVAVPANLKVPRDSLVRLEIEALGPKSQVRVQDQLSLLPSACVTHLAIDKAIYRVGDILFFRSLTLDRFSHRPPGEEFLLVATLTDGSGTRHMHNFGKIRPEGIGGGEFALTKDLAAGECTLEVAEVQGRFPPVMRRFLLVARQTALLDKTVTFNQPAYRPGDDVQVNILARRWQDGAAAADEVVDAAVNVGGKRVPVKAVQRTNARGEANIQFRMPKGTDRGPASLELRVGPEGKSQTFVKPIPLALTHLDMEFFPEGGNLVAGLESRVYFRVRDTQGTPVDMQGALVDEQGRDQQVSVGTKGQQGLGVFRFAPKSGHSYRVRITSPTGIQVRPKLPQVQEEGLIFSVPEGISREGKPVRVWLRKTGAEVGVVVAVLCQGRLVDQQAVTAGSSLTRVELNPPEGVNGVLRVTVYQPLKGQLVTLAERLVYRQPAQRLQVALETDKRSYQPGDRVQLKVGTTTEAGKAEKSWVLAAAVNEQALRTNDHAAEPDLPAHFYLASALKQPGDLDNMDIWVRDNPQSLAALDRFLGTQGWRRVVPGGRHGREKDALVKDGKAARQLAERGRPALLNLDNAAELPQKYAAVLKSRLEGLQAEADRRAETLEDQRQERIREARRAETALDEFRDWPRQMGPWVLFGLMLTFFAGGCLCLLIALVRVLRGSRATTPYFATACASLFFCMMTLLVARRLAPAGRPDATTGLDFADAPPGRIDLPENKDPKAHGLEEEMDGNRRQLAPGLYAALPERKVVSPARPRAREDTAGKFVREKEKEAARTWNLRSGDKMGRGGRDKGKDETNRKAHKEMVKRFKDAQSRQGPPRSGSNNGKNRGVPPTNPDPREGSKGSGEDSLGKKADKKKSDNIALREADINAVPMEYAHLYSGKERDEEEYLPDTILWSPVLAAPDGSTQVSFDLPEVAATYRILVYGHSPNGRLGVAHETLKVAPAKGNSRRSR